MVCSRVFAWRIFTVLLLAQFVSSTARAADDDRPVVNDDKSTSEQAQKSSLPTLYLVGDSTMNSNAPLRGWAQEIGQFFDTTKINIVNRSIGGRSSKTFMTEGRWDRVLNDLKPGDFVIVQFGHNDVGRYDDPGAKGRPSLHSDAEETVEATKPDGTKETIHSFGWYMRKYGSDAKAKGATVILCSMVPHKDWKDGHIQHKEHETFAKWTESAAKATGAMYVDLNEIIAERLDQVGQEKVETFFGDKRTHSTPAGAKFNATAVIAGLKALHPDPLEPYLGKAAADIEPAVISPAPTTEPAAK